MFHVLQPLYDEFAQTYTDDMKQQPPAEFSLELQGFSPMMNWDTAVANTAFPYHASEVEVWQTHDTGPGGIAQVHCAQLQSWANKLPGGGNLVCTGP
jgi:hypothetical protein